MKRLIRDERGQAMVMAVILLLISGLTVSSLLSYMGTGLVIGKVYETRTAELYAADAGIEDAVLKIARGNLTACPAQPNEPPFYITVNGKSVEVTITYVNNTTSNKTSTVNYLIESTASGNGSGTKIRAYVGATTVTANFSGILENVITSPCEYDLQGPTQVSPPEGEEHGPESDYPGDWPTAEILSDAYRGDVEAYPYGSGTLDVKDYGSGFGPLLREGTLEIVNTGTAGLTTELDGTLYVTGDTDIGVTDKAFTLDLNDHTIFVESASGAGPLNDPCNPEDNTYALHIGTKCTLTGSGCIIVVGNIEFKPNLSCTENDYIFVLSVRGKTYMQPNGDFYGTLAGSAEVNIQNGMAYWWESPFIDEGLNFPYTVVVNRFDTIASWEASQL